MIKMKREYDYAPLDYDKIMEILEENSEKVANIYDNGKFCVVFDENGRKTPIHSVPYEKTNIGFEMEVYVDDIDEIMQLKRGYHSGNRNVYRGGKEIFSVIERDGSLLSNGMEFITKRHKACDKRFFHWFNVFRDVLEDYSPYINDDCGGHIHVSGWDGGNEYEYVFGAFRAYEPMLIVMFGNGENGIMRYSDYADISPIIKIGRYGRTNINVITSGHFELRFFDGETEPFNWFMREMVVDAIVHIGRCVKRAGIGRYVPPDAWYDTYYQLEEYNECNQEQYKRMVEEFILLLEETHYPNAEIIKSWIKGKFNEEDYYEYVNIKNYLTISMEV